MNNILELKQGFRHSYSKEWGDKVDAEHPEKYMVFYHVLIKEDCVTGAVRYGDRRLGAVHCEYHSDPGANGEHWWIFPFSDDWDKAFKNAGVECGYYSRKKALELLSAATREWLKIMHEQGYYKEMEIIA